MNANDPLQELCDAQPALIPIVPQLQQAHCLLVNAFRNGGKLLLCGNDGSAADSDHIVGELMKGFVLPRRLGEAERRALIARFPDDGAYLADNLQGALPAISLCSHSALMTAFANDVDPEMVFAQQVHGYGKAGDVLLGLSTSGNSRNVIRALQVARVHGLHCIGFTGAGGGAMKTLCDVLIEVPVRATATVQELHLPHYHTLCRMLENTFFGQGENEQ